MIALRIIVVSMLVAIVSSARPIEGKVEIQIPQKHTLPPATSGRYGATRPPMVYLYRNPNKDLQGVKGTTLDLLRSPECGFDVREVEIPADGNVEKILVGMNLPPDTPVMVDSVHGEMTRKDGQRAEWRIDEDVRYTFDGGVPADSVFQGIRNALPGSSVFNNSCSSAGCFRSDVSKIGAAAQEFEFSFPSPTTTWGQQVETSPVMKQLLEVYCDSIQYCRKFGLKTGSDNLDTNGDYIIDGTELNAHMNAVAGAAPSGFADGYVEFQDKNLLKGHLDRCQALGGKPVWDLLKRYELDAKIQKNGFAPTIDRMEVIDNAGAKEVRSAPIKLNNGVTLTMIPYTPDETFTRPLQKPADLKDYDANAMRWAIETFVETSVVGIRLDPKKLKWDPATGVLRFECAPSECSERYAGSYTIQFSEPRPARPPQVNYAAKCDGLKMSPHKNEDNATQTPFFAKGFQIRCQASNRRKM